MLPDLPVSRWTTLRLRPPVTAVDKPVPDGTPAHCLQGSLHLLLTRALTLATAVMPMAALSDHLGLISPPHCSSTEQQSEQRATEQQPAKAQQNGKGGGNKGQKEGGNKGGGKQAKPAAQSASSPEEIKAVRIKKARRGKKGGGRRARCTARGGAVGGGDRRGMLGGGRTVLLVEWPRGCIISVARGVRPANGKLHINVCLNGCPQTVAMHTACSEFCRCGPASASACLPACLSTCGRPGSRHASCLPCAASCVPRRSMTCGRPTWSRTRTALTARTTRRSCRCPRGGGSRGGGVSAWAVFALS